jgi:RNA polymerase sigma-70 factor, ECF subfamily
MESWASSAPVKHPMPDSATSQLETVTRVRRAVAALPFDQRQVPSLVDLEGFVYCEVAKILDIPVGTVMSRLHRGRKALLPGGVDLMRVGGSRYEERVKSLSHRYQNLHFPACANAIRSLRKQGIRANVMDHVNA